MSKRDFFPILSLGLFFFLFGSWVLSLTSPDEGRNAYAALHMLKSGDWVAPYYNCHPRFEKPPLFYWLAAVSFKLFGANAFAARLVSGLSAVGTTFLVYLFGLKLFEDRKKAFLSAVVFTLFIHNWIESRSATPEFLLVFFSTLGVYLFVAGRSTLGWLSLALAFLAKGPVGVALPLGVFFLWKLSEGGRVREKLRGFFRNVFDPKGLVLFFLVGFSWYFAMLYQFGWDYFYAFFVKQNIDRFLGKLGAHRYPFWYYVPIVSLSVVLFIPLLPRVIKDFNRKLLPPLLWFLLVFFFYSLSKEKLHHYMLFAYPPLALIFGRYVGTRYIKTAFVLGVIGILSLTAAAYIYEMERFTPKAVRFLKRENPESLVFFRDENSALVFYLYRCIPQKDKVEDLKPHGFVITKRKYAPLLERTGLKPVLKGKEFGKGEEYLFKVPDKLN